MQTQNNLRRSGIPTSAWIFAAAVLMVIALTWSPSRSGSGNNHGAGTPATTLQTYESHAPSITKQDLDIAVGNIQESVASMRIDITNAVRAELEKSGAHSKADDSTSRKEPAPAPVITVQKASRSEYVVDCGSDGNCGGRGTCYIGKCFCDPGATGRHCELGEPKDCAAIADQADKLTCFFHPEFGSARVDERTWRTALAAESDVWNNSPDSNDRSEEHSRGYGHYRAIPNGASLGSYAEFGCGE